MRFPVSDLAIRMQKPYGARSGHKLYVDLHVSGVKDLPIGRMEFHEISPALSVPKRLIPARENSRHAIS